MDVWELFEAAYADHAIHIDRWPPVAAAVAAAIAWIGGGVALIASARGARPRWLLGIAAAAAAPIALALAWVIPPLLAWQAAVAAPCASCGPELLALFTRAFLATGAIAAAAAAGSALSTFALAAWPGRWRSTALGGLTLLAAALPYFASTAAFTWLAALGRAPTLDAVAPARVHVGAVPPLRVHASLPSGFTLGAVAPIDTSTPGERGVTLTATAAGVSVRREIPDLVRVGSETGSPHFPIREGATWSFEGFVDRGREARVLFQGGKRRFETKGQAALRVGAPKVHDSLRRFPLTMTGDDGSVVFDVSILAFDGETLVTVDGVERPLLTLEPRDDPPYGPAPTACRLAPLKTARCTCNARPGGLERAPPGPIRCVEGGEDVVHELTRGLFMLLSLATVDIGSSRDVQGLQLASFEPGDPAAPGVGPAWQDGPGFADDVLALRARLEAARWDEDRLRALSRAPPARPLLAEEVALLVRTFTFDQDRALIALAPHLAEPGSLDALIRNEVPFQHDQAAVRAALGR